MRLVTDPVPFQTQTVETTYEDAQNRTIEKDRRGFQTTTQRDPLGRVLTVTREGVLVEAHTYDGNGNRLTSQDGEGKRTKFAYDRANRLSSRTDGFGSAAEATTSYQYDRDGNQTIERDARAASLAAEWSVKKKYDALHRLERVWEGTEQNETFYDYDGEGNRTLQREPEGQETTHAYDELGKLTKVTQAPPAAGEPTPVTRYEYDSARNLIKQTDARNNVVKLEYDRLNRLWKRIQDPDGLNLVTEQLYDKNGNLETLKDPKGQVVTNVYDELNRLKSKTYAFAPGDASRPWRHTTGIEYGYDPNGNVTEIRESVASGTDPPVVLTTTRGYDNFNRLTSDVSPLPDGGTRTLGYSYFNNGTRKTVTDASGQVSTYTYDGQNRLETATTAAGVTTYSYYPDDLLLQVGYPNGVLASHAYDPADRLTSLTNLNVPTGAGVSGYAYTYDKNGNRLTQVEANGGRTETTSYTYDRLNRLKTVTYPGDDTYSNGRVVTYGYDAVGNRERETVREPGGAILADKQGVFDTLNRLTALNELLQPSESISFAYDPNGNQTSKTKSGVATAYRYDVRDRMVEAQEGASITGRFQYDFDGRRTKKIGEEGIRQYVYDQTSLLAEYDEAGNLKAKYDYGSVRLISLTRADEGRRYFSFDGLRSVTNLTDDTGSAVASYHLDAWGNFRFPSELDSSKNRFGFTGYIWDGETDLYFAKARFYDPQVGRFTSQDSYLGQIDDPPSLHRYFYANDRPTFFIDPTGHRPRAKQGFLLGDKPLVVTATDETTVYANPTNEQLAEQVERGEITREEAILGQVGNNTRALTATTPDYEKSWGRNFAEQSAKNMVDTATSPAHGLYEGLANQDPLRLAQGLAETTLAAAAPLVVKEGGGAVVQVFKAGARRLRGAGKVKVVDRVKGGSRLEPAAGSSEPLPSIPGTAGGRQAVAGGSPAADTALAERAATGSSVDVPYHPRAVASELEARYPGQVRPHTMVPNPSGRVLHRGREVLIDQRGFPVFDDVAAFQTQLSEPVASVASRRLHMQEATRALGAAIGKGEVSAQFNAQQMRAIQAGSDKIPNFTWHHHQQFGRMQLIPTDLHQAVGHSGGFKLWYK